MWRRSSFVEVYNTAKAQFLDRLRSAHCPSDFCVYIDASTSYRSPANLLIPRNRQPRAPWMWAVLPFHPLWAHGGKIKACSCSTFRSEHAHLLHEAYNTTDPQLSQTWCIQWPRAVAKECAAHPRLPPPFFRTAVSLSVWASRGENLSRSMVCCYIADMPTILDFIIEKPDEFPSRCKF